MALLYDPAIWLYYMTLLYDSAIWICYRTLLCDWILSPTLWLTLRKCPSPGSCRQHCCWPITLLVCDSAIWLYYMTLLTIWLYYMTLLYGSTIYSSHMVESYSSHIVVRWDSPKSPYLPQIMFLVNRRFRTILPETWTSYKSSLLDMTEWDSYSRVI
jgi:hypothetical protein